LLVEDEDAVAELIAGTLRKVGYTVLEARDGASALEVAARHKGTIDLLLTDVVMPGMNGRELGERLKETRRGVRVLYMSGHSEDAVLRHGIETSSVQFIQKPFSMGALLEKIALTLKAPAVSFR